jgi:hypothetical protein
MRISSTILLVVVLSSSTAISSNFTRASPATETGSNHIRSRSLLDEDIDDAVYFEIAGISSSDEQQEEGEENEEPQGRRSLASIGGGNDVNDVNVIFRREILNVLDLTLTVLNLQFQFQ